jgi:hypothetical protein
VGIIAAGRIDRIQAARPAAAEAAGTPVEPAPEAEASADRAQQEEQP